MNTGKPKDPRSNLEITKAILEALPDIKYRITCKSQVKYDGVRYYLELLKNQKLVLVAVDKSNGRGEERYFLSPKGEDYLNTLNEILLLEKEG